jgi:lysophospholipase L1-like esterase
VYLRQRAPKCDVLLLNCGLHDLRVDLVSRARQVPLDEYARNLGEILRLAKACARRVVWVRTTPVDDEHHNRLSAEFQRYNADVIAYNGVADACIRSAGVTVIDLYGFCWNLAAAEPGGLAALIDDHVHFTPPARKLQASYLAGHLEALHAV